jgi:hypothetical protein
MNCKQNALAGLKESLTKVDAMIAAAKGDDSTCAVFRDGFPYSEPIEKDRADAIARYLDTWVRTPLVAAIESIEGARDFSTESYLDGLAGKGWL